MTRKPHSERDEIALRALVDAEAYEEQRGVRHTAPTEDERELAAHISSVRRRAAARRMREQATSADEIPRG